MTPPIEIGILTKGKATLSMVLVSLLLQEATNVRVYIVDTGESPVIRRDDVVFALRLSIDRGIHCSYEHLRERERAFSLGKLKLMEALRGPYICFMDDDVIMPSSTLRQMLPLVERQPEFGYIAPVCRNAGVPNEALAGRSHYAPGGLIYQDEVLRSILLDYYGTTVDVLDRKRSSDKVWETAFLTELFPLLGRPCVVQDDNVTYHLDYHERPNWDLSEHRLVSRSAAVARELVARHVPRLANAGQAPE